MYDNVITKETDCIKDIVGIAHIAQSQIDNILNTNFSFKEKWLTGVEVMDYLKISKRTLSTYREVKTLGFSTFGGKLYYKLSEINQLLEDNYG